MRRLLYMVFAFIALLYTLVGLYISFNVPSGTSDPALDATFVARYEIGDNPVAMGLFIVITGISLFFLFLFLERRASKNNALKN
jgi:hypothetical protein